MTKGVGYALLKLIGGETFREVEQAADRYNAAQVKLREAYGVTVDDDEDQWRKLTGDAKRDLAPLTHVRMQELALFLWESNLLANRLIELPLAYLLAEGVRIVADDENVQDALDRFWNDPINQMDLKLPKKCRELALYGEQCYPAFVNEMNGQVRLGYLDPCLIETVVTDPDNGEQPIGIVTQKDSKGKARRYRVIVNGPEDQLFTERTRQIRETFTTGEAFYFKINDLSNGTRGRSDLLAQIDWLDAYDQFMFGELERSKSLRAFIWDVTMKGATPAEVKNRAKEITAPNPGSVRLHNDSEEWTAESPSLNAQENAETARLFRNHILGGGTLPEHWYGGGGDVNRATAGEMGDPTFKMFGMRQRYIGYILVAIGQYVIRQSEMKIGARREPDLFDPLYRMKAEWPEMVARDTTKYAAALTQVTVACATAIDKGLMTDETAVRILQNISGRLGVEYDAAEEIKHAREQVAMKAEADVFTDPTTSRDAEDRP